MKNKGFIAIFIVLLAAVCLYFGFVNKPTVVNNKEQASDVSSDNESKSYKMVKVLDYSENEKNKNGTWLFETDNYYIVEYSVNYEGRVIVYDKKGNNVTTEKFGVDNISYIDKIGSGKDYLYLVRTTDKKHGLFDKNFKAIIKLGNYGIERTSDSNYYLVGDAVANPGVIDTIENVGLYDKNGKEIIPREYERLYFGGMYNGDSYYESNKILLYARKNGKYGVVDINNKVIIPFEYDRAPSKVTSGMGEVFENNSKKYFILYKDGKYGMVDESNNVIISFDKSNLNYNKYANVVLEPIYDKLELVKVNVYNIKGELKKEIELGDNFKGLFNSHYYKLKSNNLIFYDNDYIYILNDKLEYDKYVKPAMVGYGMDTNLYLAGSGVYLKESNGKYKIYETKDNSLFANEEFYLINTELMFTNVNGFTLCKNKSDDNTYSECGVIGFDGKVILDFWYKQSTFVDLYKDDEFIEFDNGKMNKIPVSGTCVTNKNFFVRDNIIKIDSSIYDLKCNKIADDVYNYYKISKDLIITEKFEENALHNTYNIYDMNTGLLAEIVNEDNAVITNYVRPELLSDSYALVVTDKGVYKISK